MKTVVKREKITKKKIAKHKASKQNFEKFKKCIFLLKILKESRAKELSVKIAQNINRIMGKIVN